MPIACPRWPLPFISEGGNGLTLHPSLLSHSTTRVPWKGCTARRDNVCVPIPLRLDRFASCGVPSPPPHNFMAATPSLLASAAVPLDRIEEAADKCISLRLDLEELRSVVRESADSGLLFLRDAQTALNQLMSRFNGHHDHDRRDDGNLPAAVDTKPSSMRVATPPATADDTTFVLLPADGDDAASRHRQSSAAGADAPVPIDAPPSDVVGGAEAEMLPAAASDDVPPPLLEPTGRRVSLAIANGNASAPTTTSPHPAFIAAVPSTPEQLPTLVAKLPSLHTIIAQSSGSTAPRIPPLRLPPSADGAAREGAQLQVVVRGGHSSLCSAVPMTHRPPHADALDSDAADTTATIANPYWRYQHRKGPPSRDARTTTTRPRFDENGGDGGLVLLPPAAPLGLHGTAPASPGRGIPGMHGSVAVSARRPAAPAPPVLSTTTFGEPSTDSYFRDDGTTMGATSPAIPYSPGGPPSRPLLHVVLGEQKAQFAMTPSGVVSSLNPAAVVSPSPFARDELGMLPPDPGAPHARQAAFHTPAWLVPAGASYQAPYDPSDVAVGIWIRGAAPGGATVADHGGEGRLSTALPQLSSRGSSRDIVVLAPSRPSRATLPTPRTPRETAHDAASPSQAPPPSTCVQHPGAFYSHYGRRLQTQSKVAFLSRADDYRETLIDHHAAAASSSMSQTSGLSRDGRPKLRIVYTRIQ